MNSVVAKVLSLAGLVGNTPATNSFLPTARNNPRALDDFERSGELANPDIWTAYNSATSRPRTLEEMLRIWDEMSHWDLMAAALSEITDEATQTDAVSPGLIWYECSDRKLEDALNQMLTDINAEEHVPSQVWHIAGYGNNFEKLDYSPGNGVLGFMPVHPMEIRRYWLRRNRRCVGFRWQNNNPDKNAVLNIGNTTFSRATMQSGDGANQLEQLWYPWDFLHMRRMRRSRQSEHGEPLFEEAQGIYKKLRMAIDHMTVLRAQVQPDRFVVNIDTKDAPQAEQYRIVNRWKQSLRSKLSFGSGTSGPDGQPDDFKAFYQATALDTILWLAKPRDFGHTIDKIAGTASVPDVHDIEMLTNLFFAIIGMPKSWIGLGTDSGTGGPASGKALLAQDMRFLRKVKTIRQPVINGYTWLGYFHLLLAKHDISNVELQAKMTPIGTLEDQVKLELLQAQTEILDRMADILPKYGLPREAWMDIVFRKYMHLPDDIVDAFLTALPPETELAAESAQSNKTKQASASKHWRRKFMEECQQALGGDFSADLNRDIADIMGGNRPRRRKINYRTAEDVLRPARLVENDIIVSGFGQIDPITDMAPQDAKTDVSTKRATTVTERFTDHPGYRPYVDIHVNKQRRS